MTRIDIQVKYPGRVVDLPIREGDVVRAGAVLARQDDAETKTQIAAAEAEQDRARDAIGRAEAEVEANRRNGQLAQLEWTETNKLYAMRIVSLVELERRRLALDSQEANVDVAAAGVKEARSALERTAAEIERLRVVLNDLTVRAPAAGRIEFKVIEKNAVLPAGGRVALLLVTADVYMTIFLPSEAVSKLTIGDEARIAIGVSESLIIPAYISFVSPDAQFTPKYVETATEREKLVYRIKLQIPIEIAKKYEGRLKAGETGNGYVRLDRSAPWPASLSPRDVGGGSR
jgi:HlyD family secretion protein